jgi:hypothetical protein
MMREIIFFNYPSNIYLEQILMVKKLFWLHYDSNYFVFFSSANQVTTFYQSQLLKNSSVCDVCPDCGGCP